MQWQNRSSVHSKKSASGSGYIKPGTWPGQISSITLKCSTTVTDATAISEASARRPSKRPRREDRNCLPERGHSRFVYGLGGTPTHLAACPLLLGKNANPLTVQHDYFIKFFFYLFLLLKDINIEKMM